MNRQSAVLPTHDSHGVSHFSVCSPRHTDYLSLDGSRSHSDLPTVGWNSRKKWKSIYLLQKQKGNSLSYLLAMNTVTISAVTNLANAHSHACLVYSRGCLLHGGSGTEMYSTPFDLIRSIAVIKNIKSFQAGHAKTTGGRN